MNSLLCGPYLWLGWNQGKCYKLAHWNEPPPSGESKWPPLLLLLLFRCQPWCPWASTPAPWTNLRLSIAPTFLRHTLHPPLQRGRFGSALLLKQWKARRTNQASDLRLVGREVWDTERRETDRLGRTDNESLLGQCAILYSIHFVFQSFEHVIQVNHFRLELHLLLFYYSYST